jgi:hypothetical protein
VLFTVPRYVTTGGSGKIIRKYNVNENGFQHSPIKFDGDDIVAWPREFDACALANGWKDEDKIKKLAAFLRERAATYFYATPVAVSAS